MIQVVNSIFRGRLGTNLDLKDIQKRLDGDYSNKLYMGRPHMLRIRHGKTTLLLFPTGRFRIMGGELATPELAIRWLQKLSPSKWTGVDEAVVADMGLLLQSCTVKFKVKSECVSIILKRYTNVISYEPELFSAGIHLKRWNDVHVNLFFSGNVIVLGRKAYQRAFEVRQWLEHIGQQPIPKLASPTLPSSSSSSIYDESIKQLVLLLPDYYRTMAQSYFYCYPLKLIKSWIRQITIEGEADTLIPRLCTNIAQYSS